MKPAVTFVALLFLLVSGYLLEAAEKPNIIYTLADDFGLSDIGCYGSAYKTPNLDGLAAGGTRFEYCFAAPLCAPTRAMGMFGRYGFRTGVTDNGLGAAATPQSEVCIAKVLRQAGYATTVAVERDPGFH
jgi:arylsulfatase A-like enzyme